MQEQKICGFRTRCIDTSAHLVRAQLSVRRLIESKPNFFTAMAVQSERSCGGRQS